MACTENNCAEVILNKQRCSLRGYLFLQIRRSWKSWGSQIFFCEKYWVSTWNKQDIIGWLGLQYFTEFVLNENPPCKLSTLRLMGVALLVCDNTAVPRAGSYNFCYQIRGSQNIAEPTFGNLWTPIPKYGGYHPPVNLKMNHPMHVFGTMV